MTEQYPLIPLEELPPDAREWITKEAILQYYADQMKERLEVSQVDVEGLVSLWLSSQKSKKTRTAYSKALSNFFAFLDPLRIHPLLIHAEHVDRYSAYLSESLKNNSVRLKMSACSSFYSRLKRYGHIKANPFHGAPLPSKEFKKTITTDQKKTFPVMNEKEYEALMAEVKKRIETPGIRACDILRREGAKKLLLAMHFMGTYGLRSGAIENLEIRAEEKRLLYTTKGGKSASRPLSDETFGFLKSEPERFPLAGYKMNTMQKALRNVTLALKEKGYIRESYSCHDFRHFFAVNHYRKYKDIFALQHALDHASINVTQIYLQGLGFDESGREKGTF